MAFSSVGFEGSQYNVAIRMFKLRRKLGIPASTVCFFSTHGDFSGFTLPPGKGVHDGALGIHALIHVYLVAA